MKVSEEWRGHARDLRRIAEMLERRPTTNVESHIKHLFSVADDVEQEAEHYARTEEAPFVPARTLTFHGESDDLFEVGGTVGGEPDEIGCYGASSTVRVATEDGSEGLHVTALYSPGKNGCWTIGISQIDEDRPLPNWPHRWLAPAGRGYSVSLELDVPDGVSVEEVT